MHKLLLYTFEVYIMAMSILLEEIGQKIQKIQIQVKSIAHKLTILCETQVRGRLSTNFEFDCSLSTRVKHRTWP
jgi:hypothetical protein